MQRAGLLATAPSALQSNRNTLYMGDLRTILPNQVTRGALLRPDGVAVGLVIGGAPAWDLLSLDGRAQTTSDYHHLLLATAAPLDIYVVDQPPALADDITTLLERQAQADHPLLAQVLGELAEYLEDLSQQGSSRAKQVIWAVSSSGDAASRAVGSLDLSQFTLGRTKKVAGPSRAEVSALAQAVEKARRLADALHQLGGAPPPRLMEAEEIAALVYQLVDPVRSQRYPLAGTLLDRVRRVVTLTPE